AQVQRREAVAGGGREQRAVIAVGPAVVRTGDASETAAAALEKPRATMAAHVAQRADAAIRLAQHDHAVGAKLESDVVAGARYLPRVADDLPAGFQDPLDLEAGHLRMVVDPGRQPLGDRG